LQQDDDDDDDDDEDILMDKSHINIIPNLDDPIPLITVEPSSPLNQPVILLDTINDIIKRLFEIKRSDKTFFLNNESNLQLDSLLKNDLCTAIQNILEHGRKDQKKSTLWKIIHISISSSEQIPRVYYEAKQLAQNASSHWLYKFQAFIFALLNKNELINWLYYFTRQKDIIQRYYQSPDALILVSISSTFNLFERIMTQLEKLTSLTFHLTYHPPSNDEQLNTSIITNPSIKSSARDWVMTLSRRTSKNSNDTTFRSTLSRRFNSIFTKTNTSVVTTKLPGPSLSNIFPNSTEQNSSIATFQSKIPRPSLNVDKPKSVRYRSTTFPSK